MNDLLGTVKKGQANATYEGPDVEEGFEPPPSEADQAMQVSHRHA